MITIGPERTLLRWLAIPEWQPGFTGRPKRPFASDMRLSFLSGPERRTPLFDWDAFISHAGPDKESVARPLAVALEALGFRIWFDEFALRIGDSLRRSIDKGLAHARFGIVILSPNFFAREWPQAELDALVGRQREGNKVILPVWHRLSQSEVRAQSPLLADLLAVRTDDGIPVTAGALADAMRDEGTKPGFPSGLPGANEITQTDRKGGVEQTRRAKTFSTYAQNLIADIHNNLVLELYDKSHYEDLCITPLMQAAGSTGSLSDIADITQLAQIYRSSVIGEPGSGKTTALRLLALQLLRRVPLEHIPIYLPLASFGRFEKETRLSFSDYIDDEIAMMGGDTLADFRRMPGCDVMLLLDGWDEVSDESRRHEAFRYLSSTDLRFIVTARPEAQRSLPAAERFEMYPLSNERIREFIKLRVKDSLRAEDLFSWIMADTKLLSLARNPLNLSLLGIVFHEQQHFGRVTKTKVYERAFEAILNQHHRAHLHPYDGSYAVGDLLTTQIESLLEDLAYRTIIAGDGRFFSTKDLYAAAQRALGQAPPPNLVELLAGRLGIVRDRRSGRFEFFHLWYQEFLSARHIVNSGQAIADQIEHSRLANVLPYVVGLLPSSHEAARLLQRIFIHDVFNYCRALGEAELDEGVMQQLLCRATNFGENHKPKLPVRVELARALSQAGIPALPILFSICRSEEASDYARRAALEAIGYIGTPGPAFEDLLLGLLTTESRGLLWHVLEHVGNRAIAAASVRLKEYVSSPDPIVAGDSLWALRRIQGPPGPASPTDLNERLIACLECNDGHIQGRALRTIGRLKMREAISALHTHLVESESAYRWIVPEAAVLIGGPEGMALLQEALRDHDVRVTGAALRGIAEIDYPVPVDVHSEVENFIGDETWIPFLEQSLGSVARATLGKLTRKRMKDKAATIYLARHCTTAWNAEQRLQGTIDLPLADVGISEARANVPLICSLGVTRIVSSTARRAYETAQIYADALGVPLVSTPGLRELDGRAENPRPVGGTLLHVRSMVA